MGNLNLIKLCVGSESIESLIAWRRAHPERANRHVTRMWPKRSAELLDGGSLYWVIKGEIQARQTILRLDECIGGDGIRRCAIVMDPQIVRTVRAPRRPFQGWRYLSGADAPPDISPARQGETNLPADLEMALADLGVR